MDAEAFASRLPTRYRDLLVLRYYYEAKTREIAIILGMSESTFAHGFPVPSNM
ncbi:MAG: sigma factor-like helix-turn-helix DNA-binding protein [Hydrogeniiclostridium mannosilyticum]